MLESVEWGEYRLGDLFEIHSSKKRFDANKVIIGDKGYPYVVRTSQNNGIKGCIEGEEVFLNEANTISFGQDTATMYYQSVPYFTGDKIKILKPKLSLFNKGNAQFFISCLQKPFLSFSWGASSFNVQTLEKQIIQLPTRNGGIDFEFMERFIAELNAARLAELNAYLTITGLSNYELTREEEQALADFSAGKTQWEAYQLGSLFEIKPTSGFNKDALTLGNEYDYVTRTSQNQGILQSTGFVNEEYLNEAGTWSLGLLQMDFFYRRRPWYAGQFVRKIAPKITLREAGISFLSTILNKQKEVLLSVLVRDVNEIFCNTTVNLPTRKGKIDYELMETFISAIQKLVIKDVVCYADSALQATQAVIAQRK